MTEVFGCPKCALHLQMNICLTFILFIRLFCLFIYFLLKFEYAKMGSDSVTTLVVKFGYSEKATKFGKIFQLKFDATK